MYKEVGLLARSARDCILPGFPNFKGVCPAGGQHEQTGSFAYATALERLVVSPQVITAQQLAPAQGGAANFVITGAGFQPSATINIYVLSTTSAGANRVVFADGQGKFNVTLELPCFPGTVLSIKAVNLAQNQTSNTVTVTCT